MLRRRGHLIGWVAAGVTAAAAAPADLADRWPETAREPGDAGERVAAAVPLPFPCLDRRYPRLAGPYVVGCGPDGGPDRFLVPGDGWVTLASPADDYAVGDGTLYALGADRGLWALPDPTPRAPAARVDAPVGPPGRGAGRVAYATRDALVVFEDPKHRYLHDARPDLWQPPAIAGDAARPLIVWAEVRGGDVDLHALEGKDPVPFATGPGRQHHAAANGPILAWVDDGDVVVADVIAGTRTRFAADAGFEGPPAVGADGLVCWGDRGDGFRVRCSDGLDVPGRMPSIGAGAVLVHDTEGGATLWSRPETAP